MARTPKSGDAAAAPASGLHLFTGDKVLWVIIAVLAVISVLVVYSSTAKMAYAMDSKQTISDLFHQQLIYLCISFCFLIVVQRINCRLYNKLTPLAYWGFVGLTLFALILNKETNGAARWIPIGGFRMQPSEGLKIATILMLARQLASRQSRIDKIRIIPSLNPLNWRTPAQRKIWREGTLPILMPVLTACVVIAPAHTSSAALVFIVSWVMMLIGRVRMRELMRLLLLIAVAASVAGALDLGRSSTAGGRLSTWVELWMTDRTAVPVENLTDTDRSMIAIHNGGFLGEGAGQSVMRVEMIHPESDYVYAFFVEEYGLILAILLLLIYLWIFFRGIEIFRRCGTAFPGLLVLGLALLITAQALVHIMVTVNLLPETGQCLPLISRGGSAMFCTAIALGMILSVSRQNDENSHDMPRSETILESGASSR